VISVDLHVHTCASVDCSTPIEDVAQACIEAGIDCVAITDHNEIRGALALRDLGRVQVIVGEEIRTTKGELQGLFLSELIPGGLSPEETIDRIKSQGGLVCMPHPFVRTPYPSWAYLGRRDGSSLVTSPVLTGVNGLLTGDVLSRLDVIETINSRTPFKWNWKACRKLASLCELPQSAGSDAHTVKEVGRARITMEPFDTAEGFMRSLATATISGRASSLFVHYRSTIASRRARRR